MINGYENQRERLEQRIESLEQQTQRVNNANAQLINENKCLSKGSAQANSKYFYMKDEGKLMKKIEEQEKVKENLMKALARKEETIESNIEELDTIKEVKEQLSGKIRRLEYDLKNSPSINDLHILHNTIAKFENENRQLKAENNNLENENMLLKNNTNTHFRSQSKETDKILTVEASKKHSVDYDNSTAVIILKKVLEILNIENPLGKFCEESSCTILETVKKIQKVVMAVPRMESFIKQLCSAVFPHQQSPQLENIIPEIYRLHSMIYSYQK